MAYFDVDKDFYLKNKLASLKNDPAFAEEWANRDEAALEAFFAGAGLTVQQHFDQYGWAEGLSANATFDVAKYLSAKAALLNEAAFEGKTDWTSADVAAAFQAAGLTVEEHFTQYGEAEGLKAEPVDATNTLTEALSTYQGAVAAEESFLKSLASNATFLGAFAEADAEAIVEAKTATASDIADAVANVESNLDAALTVVNSTTTAGAGENTFLGLIADAKKDAADAITEAQADLTDAQKNPALTTQVKAALKGAAARLDVAFAAEEKVVKAGIEVTRQKSIAEANLTALGSAISDADDLIDSTGTAPKLAATLSAEEKKIGQSYLDALKAELAAEDAQATAFEALVEALENAGIDFTAFAPTTPPVLEDIDSGYGISAIMDGSTVVGYELNPSDYSASGAGDLLVAQNNLNAAKAEQADLLAAIAAYNAVGDIEKKAEELNQAIDDAYEAITNSVEDGGLGIALKDIDGSLFGLYDTTDLFVFSGKQGEISFFEAEDQLFFGTKYTFVELASTVDMSKDRVGDDAVLEIFYQAKDGNITFFVEAEAEAGRDVVKNDGIVEVVLTGVTEVATADGFVTLA